MPTWGASMLKFENVSLRYGSFLALDGVSLHADRGELVVLLGANGAGKSSLFLTASGIHKAAGGSIVWNGRELAGSKPSAIVQSGVVQCPEGRKLFPQDRKSTRLNSSHLVISYAVFCL